MRLLMISGDRSILAGRQGAFHSMLEEFSKHWDRIDVIVPWTGRQMEKPLFGNVYVHSSSHGIWYQPRWIRKKGRELIAKHGHDVMTVHEYSPFYNGRGAYRLHRATGIPYAIEIHHIVGYPRAASRSERIGRMLSEYVLPREARKAQAVRVVNEEVKNVLTKWDAPSRSIHVVPSFYLDSRLLKPDPRIEKEFDFVFCGRLAANKGLLTLIEAVSDNPGTTLLVIGDGPLRAKAERRARGLGVKRNVHFTGWLPETRHVVRAMQTGKIFVMNSLSEGGPRVSLEAMACGMPVIATRIGVMPEVMRDGENGLFTTGDRDDLARTMRILLEDERLQHSMGKAAQAVIQTFDRAKLIKKYAEFLKRIARSN